MQADIQESDPPNVLYGALLVGVSAVVALGAAAAGLFYLVHGMVGQGVGVTLPIKQASAGWFLTAPPAIDDAGIYGMGDANHGIYLEASGGISANVGYVGVSDALTVALGRSPGLATGVCLGLVLALLVPVLRSIAQGVVFSAGAARRLTLCALTTIGGAAAATVLPYLGARRFLAMPYGGDGQWEAAMRFVWWPLPIAALFLVLALSVRAGTRLADDTAGLV